ncbi:sigma-70 family RNA polymerase sigma factor [Tranquillimonas alkanivorans]|uniref:RNA polymerase sigma-32 factor n=1 Tax=Tranquillimonas alkanivorans TaxID=441119 RepID=A0A1I5WES2_9RHOB|nr:sigma-70 family RNA polymerase sigma factor [Tranquillimonas alkanivorans]SFQ18313.1 RNA polymerase sigma-32 factor [Tranquillimonas alkanivorans]
MTASISSISTAQMIRNQTKDSILSYEEERALVEAYANDGDAAARQKLITSHRPLAVSLAQKMSANGTEFEDLFQEAICGLAIAIDRFNPDHKTRFSAYAAWWMMEQMRGHISRSYHSVRIGRSHREKKTYTLLVTAYKIIGADLDDAVLAKIAEEAKATPEEVNRVYQVMLSRGASLNKPVAVDEGASEMVEFLVDEDAPPVDAGLVTEEQGSVLEDALEELRDPRAADIVRARNLTLDPETPKSLGKKMGLSPERVRQIERHALVELRRVLAGRGFTPDMLLGA